MPSLSSSVSGSSTKTASVSICIRYAPSCIERLFRADFCDSCRRCEHADPVRIFPYQPPQHNVSLRRHALTLAVVPGALATAEDGDEPREVSVCSPSHATYCMELRVI